ncbi:MAG: hypothetical protein HY816_19915 [Candidatus Wallbacteria bacterium]|nr:hypothetical protein [Candidatus Wallbacteria bacterium]
MHRRSMWGLIALALVVGAWPSQAASPVFGPGSGLPSPGVYLQERDRSLLTPKDRAFIWDKIDGPGTWQAGVWKKFIGASPIAHSDTHKVGGTDSVGAASTSTAGLARFAPSGAVSPTYAVAADDLRLNNARTPTAHQETHRLNGSDAMPRSSTSTAGLAQFSPAGATSPTYAVEANDPRLSDSRTPTVHGATHQLGGLDPLPAATTATAGLAQLAGDGESNSAKVPAANDSRLSDSRAPTVHQLSHRIGGGDALPAADTSTPGLVALATDGESSGTKAPAANDSRLSDARTPTAHASTHAPGGSDPVQSGSAAQAGLLQLAADAESNSAKAAASNDSRLSNARAPTAHEASHRVGGSDALPAASTTTRGLAILADSGAASATYAVEATDPRLSDSRTPTTHGSSHIGTGSDPIPLAVAGGAAGLMSGTQAAALARPQNMASTTSDITLTTQLFCLVDTTSNPVTVTLPPVASLPVGSQFIVKHIGGDAGANPVTIQGQGGTQLDSGTSMQISATYGSMRITGNNVDHWWTW